MCVQGTNKFLIEAVRNKLGNSEVNVNGIRNVIGMLTLSLFNSFFEIKKFVVYIMVLKVSGTFKKPTFPVTNFLFLSWNVPELGMWVKPLQIE